MKSRIYTGKVLVILTGLLLAPGHFLLGQVTIKAGNSIIEHRVVKGSTVNLEIQEYRGTLQWQQSDNGSTWLDWSGKTSPQVQLIANQEIYIRVAVSSENCDPVHSGAAHIITFEQPNVTTTVITNISTTEAQSGGEVTSDGGDPVTARGICWSTSTMPTISGNHTLNGSGIGTFASLMTGLTPATIYYVRAYATNNAGTAYGDQKQFTTDQEVTLPSLTTASITDKTQTSAIGGGNVTSDGGGTVTARGVCWSTSSGPTTANSKTIDGGGTGTFTSSLTGLTASTFYYVRAYATNSAGTAYGNEVTFTTSGTANLPTVTTATASVFNFTNATCGGTVTNDGGATVTARGVCYNTTGTPVVTDSKTIDGSGTGTFTSTISGLDYGTRYYVRAYATNSAGTAYGDEKNFQTWNEVGTFTDSRDGHQYIWVKIKDQVWMHDNLAWLPGVSPSNVGSDASGYYYVYGNEGTDVDAAKATESYTTYGVLYNWPAAMASCPSGWHLPTDEEWKTLEKNLGMTESDANGTLWRNSGNVGMMLKSSTGWANNGNGWNLSGFKALPGGHRDYSTGYLFQTTTGYFWTANEVNTEQAWFRGLYSGNMGVNRYYTYKRHGISVRCLKD